MSEDSLPARIMTELARIAATQDHIIKDIDYIKNELRDLRSDNGKRDDKISDLELHQANVDGQHNVVTGILSFGAAVIASVITAIVSWMMR